MKKKNAMALFLAGTMLMSQTVVFADAKVSTTSDSVIENDNSTAPTVQDVILPTITGDTYDFTLDRQGLLSQYGAAADKYDGSNVYFDSISKPAYITTTVTSGSDTVEVEALEVVKEEADLGVLLENIATVTDDDKTGLATAVTFKADATKVYVYGPKDTVNNKSTNTGAGDYEEITVGNILNYFDVFTVDDGNGTMVKARVDFRSDINTLAVGGVCTGVLYQDDYQPVDPVALANSDANAATQYFKDFDTTLAFKDSSKKLYYYDDVASPAAYKELSINDFTYTPAVHQFANVSQGAKVVNKSTNPIAVSVDVTFSNVEGLTFLASDEITDTLKTNIDASGNRGVSTGYGQDEEKDGIADVCGVWFSLTAGDNISYSDNAADIVLDKVKDTQDAKVKAATGSATMILEAAPYKTMTYQGADTDLVAATGSHNYYQYFTADEVPFNSSSFYLTGVVDTDPTADDLWEKYVEGIENGTYQKPSVSVVYSFAPAERKETIVTDSDDNEYEVVSYVVTQLATRNTIKEKEAAVDEAQAEADKLQGQYNTAYKAYLDAKEKDEAQAKLVAEKKAEYDKALAEMEAIIDAKAIDAYNADQKAVDASGGSPTYANVAAAKTALLTAEITYGGDKATKYGKYTQTNTTSQNIAGWFTAQEAYVTAVAGRLKDEADADNIDFSALKTTVDGSKKNVLTPATPTYTGTYATLHDAIIKLETERASLNEAKTALSTAKTALSTAKSNASVQKTYSNNDYEMQGSLVKKDEDGNPILDTSNDYWE